MIITYKQCAAARELLGWKRVDLEKKSNISRSTIADFERGKRKLRMDNLEKLLITFKDAGIKFINEDGTIGVKIDLTKIN